MGTGSQVASVTLRLFELISGAVVAGLVGEYLHYVDNAHDSPNSRMVYAVAIAGISIVASMVLMPPLKYSFYFFALDFALFICWMVAFGLLVNLSGSGSCNSYWYWSSWGYYWGGYYHDPISQVNQALVGTQACGKWRATIAWSFIGGFCWLLNSFVGFYNVLRYHEAGQAWNKSNLSYRLKGTHSSNQATMNTTQEMSEGLENGTLNKVEV